MPLEKSAGAVVFRKEPFGVAQGKDNKIYYLLLNYPSSSKSKKPCSRVNSLRGRDYWDLPKGHIEKGEKIEETAKREVEEETGLKDIKFVEGFKAGIKYFFRLQEKNIFKIVIFLLAETKTKEVKISFEHIGYEWLPYEEALGRLTFKNAKDILTKAEQYLSKKEN